jgi:hypothetical protein
MAEYKVEDLSLFKIARRVADDGKTLLFVVDRSVDPPYKYMPALKILKPTSTPNLDTCFWRVEEEEAKKIISQVKEIDGDCSSKEFATLKNELEILASPNLAVVECQRRKTGIDSVAIGETYRAIGGARIVNCSTKIFVVVADRVPLDVGKLSYCRSKGPNGKTHYWISKKYFDTCERFLEASL